LKKAVVAQYISVVIVVIDAKVIVRASGKNKNDESKRVSDDANEVKGRVRSCADALDEQTSPG
jgi:hypothetical protein